MIDWQKDVWHIPEFFELLTQQQEEFDKAITGQISAQRKHSTPWQSSSRIHAGGRRITSSSPDEVSPRGPDLDGRVPSSL